MKKLTAGILASLIGLVSANSADAAVASKAYVDGAIETLDVAETGGTTLTEFVGKVSETDGKISAGAKKLEDVIVGGGSVDVRLVTEGENAGKLEVYGTEHYDEGLGINISEDNKISTDIKAGSDNVTIGQDGDTVTISVTDENTEYTFADDIVEDENGAYHTSYYDATNTDVKTAEQETAAGDGWYVLMRKADATQPNGYKYQWENLDRSYDANEISVAHNE